MLMGRITNVGDSKSRAEGNAFSFSQDTVVNAISEFIYDPEEELTFSTHFHRYADIFENDCHGWNDKKSSFACLENWVQ